MRKYQLLGAAAAALFTGQAFAGAITGPSSSQSPYVLPTAKGFTIYSLLTTGDSVPLATNTAQSYQFAGTPDGIGAYDNGDGTLTLLVNHEFRATQGSVRAHGATGAFVSQFVVSKSDLSVQSGRDFATELVLTSGTAALERLCSGDLAALSAFYNPVTGKGHNGRIYLNGEETTGGRAFGWVVGENKGYQLAALGAGSWENQVANPGTGDRTLVAGTEDSGGGHIRIYIGSKSETGNVIERAGLTNGASFAIRVLDGNGAPVLAETDAAGLAGAGIGAVDKGSLVRQSARFDLAATITEGTGFQRPEDISWDPNNPNVAYFVTTASITGNSRLWRVVFEDVNAANPTGRIEMLLDGSEGHRMLDNLTVGTNGKIYIQEDVGGNPRLGLIWEYNTATGGFRQVAQHDAARFLAGGANFLTEDEESSGILDVTALFRGSPMDASGRDRFYVFDDQAHYALPNPLVEGGQLLLLVQAPEPGMLALFGLGAGAALAARRRRAG